MQIRNGVLGALAALVILTGCGGSDGNDEGAEQFVTKVLLENYADNVIVPTYDALAARAGELTAAVTALRDGPTEATLTAARAAWVATRAPWEQSEGFLFGPVDANGYDPAMDSWPLNNTDLQAVITSGETLSAAYIATLANNQKGFHTVEFLIYGEDSNKPLAAFTTKEHEYLIGASQNLQDVAETLAESWTAGVDGSEPFRTTFVTAGETGNTVYPSLTAAGEEIVKGLIGICDEVADVKIAEPFATRNKDLVESQFSFNSLQDFSDNLRSVENVWLGFAPGKTATAGASLSEHVAAVDAALDTRVKAEITAAIEAILAIPSPFPDTIRNPGHDDKIKAAQDEIRVVRKTLFDDVLPLVAK